jgi:hypothetical protein
MILDQDNRPAVDVVDLKKKKIRKIRKIRKIQIVFSKKFER